MSPFDFIYAVKNDGESDEKLILRYKKLFFSSRLTNKLRKNPPKIGEIITFKYQNLTKNKKPRLITVSRFDKRKNHEKTVMALRNLKQTYPNIIYICIGYGDEEENIKKLVKEYTLKTSKATKIATFMAMVKA